MSRWLKCCGISDQATDIYLTCYGSWEKYFCCQTLDMLLCSVSSNILKTGKGKADKVGTVPEQAVKEHLSYELQIQISCMFLVSSCQLLHCSGTSHHDTGSNDLQIGSNTHQKKKGISVKNNTICNENKWMEDNALISQLAQPSLELLLKKRCSLLWSHPTLKLVTIALLMFSFMVFSCWQ